MFFYEKENEHLFGPLLETGIRIFNVNLINLGYWDTPESTSNKVAGKLSMMFRCPDAVLEINLKLGKRVFFVAFLETAHN